MIRPQETQSHQGFAHHNLHRIKTKFHRKHLALTTIEELYLKKVRLKNVFCRSYKEQEPDRDIIFELNKHRYLKNKPLCGLKTVEIASVAKLHWFSQLKNLKNLESLTIWIGEEDWKATRGFANIEAKVHFLLRCLKRLSKKMKTLKLYIEGLSVKDLRKVYRIVGSFRELRVFERRLGFEGDQSYLELEHKYMTQYLKRMKKLEEFDYDYWRFRKEDWDDGELDAFPDPNQDQSDYHGMMTRGEIFKYVTGLNLAIRGSTLETFDADSGEFRCEKIGEVEAVSIRREIEEEVASFYRFELFPNLQNLMIDINENSIYPMGAFMIGGFKTLKKLEKLSLILNDRPQQANYAIQALEQLPLLTSFYLSIEFLRKDEWLALQNFIGKQRNLVSFRLRLVGLDISLQENDKLEELLASLSQDSKLEYLQISANTISLERISNAVKSIPGTNRLKHLTIAAIDDPTTSAKPAERCKGICDLISRHKESLTSLKFEFVYVVVPEMIGILTSAIGGLKNLKKLQLEVNKDEELAELYESFFKEHLTIKEMAEDQRWICQITKMLEKLEKLETIEVNLPELSSINKVIADQFMKMFGTILSLKTIGNVNLCMPFNVIKQPIFHEFTSLVLKMQPMRKVSLNLGTERIINPFHADFMWQIVQEASSHRLAKMLFSTIQPKEVQSAQDIVSHDLHRIKTKFHRKHLALTTIEELYLKKVRLKNVFCRSYKEQEPDRDIIFELNKHRYLKNKPLCGLKTVEIASVAKLHWFSQLKNLKNLESLTIWIGEEDWKATRGFANIEAKVHFLLRCLKRLSKKMKTLKLYIEGLSVKDLRKVYRIVSSSRELEAFYRRLGFEREESYLKQEHKYMNQYLKRMKMLKEVDYDYWRFVKKDWINGEPLYFPELNQDQVDFREMMERREMFTFVTQLNFDVNGEILETFVAGFGEFGEELINQEGQSKAVRVPSKTKQEISLFYRFELFPNLKSLMMNFDDGYLYPLGAFVVEGFKALAKLQKLSLLINERPQQTNYIFQGLEHLPLLNSFYLAIENLKKDEWGLLKEFIGRQKDLVSFSFHILGNDGNFERENSGLKTLFEDVNSGSKLKYLEVASSKFSLNALSIAFFKIPCKNQLKHLKLEGIDDPTVSNPADRCRGICDLIIRNKESLLSIEWDIHYVVIAETIRMLTEAIGEVRNLKSLRLKVNYVENFLKDSLEGLFKDCLEDWEMDCLSENEGWIGAITNMLSKFNHLETIELGFQVLPETNDMIVSQFMRLLDVVFSLKFVTNIFTNIPFKVLDPKMLENFSDLFRGMRQPQKISFAFYTKDLEDLAVQENFSRLVEEFKALRLQNVRIM